MMTTGSNLLQPTRRAPPALTLDTSRGRLLASGPLALTVSQVQGAVYDYRHGTATLLLTMETCQTVRRLLGWERAAFIAVCTPRLLSWALAAAARERQAAEAMAAAPEPFPWQTYQDVTLGGRSYAAGETIQPFAHQIKLATVASKISCGFICDVGTGKTRPACEALRHWHTAGAIGPMVVVAPLIVQRTWREEIPRWLGWETVTLDGPVGGRAAALRDQANWAKVFLVNYEVLDKLKETLLALPSLGIIFDEGHRLRNPQAQRTKAAIQISRTAVWRLLLTGSPIIQGAHEAWSQWYLLDHGTTFGESFPMFRDTFFSKDPWGKLSPRKGTPEKIGARMLRFGLRYRKEECLDLPPRLYQTLDVTMGPAQKRAYREMADRLLTAFGESEATAANQLVAMLRLSQITSGHVPTDAGLHRFTENPKLDALEEFVEENIGTAQIVVWCRYREDIRIIRERLARLTPGAVEGESTTEGKAARDAALRDFAAGRTRLIVCNPQSGGSGLNELIAGSIAVYYSQDWNREHREQSEGRVHRSGSEQHAKITYVDLIMTETIDGLVLDALRAKATLADLVTNCRYHLEQL